MAPTRNESVIVIMTERSHPTKISVLVVDDHRVVRNGLRAFLLSYDDLVLVGEAVDGEDAVRQCAALRPDVVLMDMVLPGMDGAAATRAIRSMLPDTQVIALTSFPDEELVAQALGAGALSYLLKDVDPDELAAAIRNAIRGQPTLAPEATRALVQAAARPPVPEIHLTERERSVLALMIQGLTNLEIAQQLGVKHSTIRFHVSNILSKLGVNSRTEAVAFALQNKLTG
jgi:NarL family two-component system response regulator LiaR